MKTHISPDTAETVKHTAGPWVAIVPPSSSPAVRQIVTEDTRTLLAEVVADPSTNIFHQVANARLIAAAPELLAALEKNLATLENIRADIRRNRPFAEVAADNLTIGIDRARAAIAKATGGAK